MRVGALVLAALSGVSAWVSLGTQAITNAAHLTRIAAFPPFWLLFFFALVAVAGAAAARLSLARAWPLALSGLLWLPYLPWDIPAAFLIWQGPIETAVWLAIVVGLFARSPIAWWPTLDHAARDPRKAPWLAGAVVALCALAGFTALRGVIPNGDEPHYLAVTQSILLDGDLRIENNHARGDYLSYFGGRLRPDYLQRGDDGEIYSVHAPGVSLMVLPAFAVAGYAGVVTFLIAAVALAAALTWHIAWLLSASVVGAWVGCAAVFLTTPFFFHEFAIYPDAPSAVLVMVPIWLLVRLELGRELSRLGLWAGGVALAALPWFHTRFAIIAAVLGVVLLLRLARAARAWGNLVALFTVPVLAAVAWFGYFWIIWGTVSPTAPYGEQTNSAVANIGRGAVGLLIDQQFGLIATAPIYAVAGAGLVWMAGRHRRLSGELLLVIAPYLFSASSYAMWWGGNSAPARFLVALMPLAALPIAWWWSRLCEDATRAERSRTWRALTLVMLLVSIVMVLPRAWVDGGRLLYNNRTGIDLVLDWAARSVDLPLAFPSVHRSSAAGALTDAMVWLGAGLLLAIVAFVLTERSRAGAGATWTVVTLAGAVAAMLGCSVVWAMHGVTAVTSSRSSIAALSAYSPSFHRTVLQLMPFQALSAGDFAGRIEFGTTDRQALATTDPARLRAAGIPAGDYAVISEGSAAPRGAISVVIGRNDTPIDQWRMDEHASGVTGVSLRLPVAVAALTLRGDGTDRATLPDLRLRALSVRSPANGDGRPALRATRYGRARVFFFDEQAYLEPAGFWTRAGGAATVVIDLDESARTQGARLFLRAGAVATTIDVSVGAWRHSWSLQAGQEELIALPPADAAVALTLRSGAGFRPFAIDSASDDLRELAVWVEIR